MTAAEIIGSGLYRYHHTDCRRINENACYDWPKMIEKYHGVCGTGWIIYGPRYDTPKYCYVEYWIRKEDDGRS